jgi:hypothetical protein
MIYDGTIVILILGEESSQSATTLRYINKISGRAQPHNIVKLESDK